MRASGRCGSIVLYLVLPLEGRLADLLVDFLCPLRPDDCVFEAEAIGPGERGMPMVKNGL